MPNDENNLETNGALDVPFGVILGGLSSPIDFVGMRLRPTGDSPRRWLRTLRADGCALALVEASGFDDWSVRCAGPGFCQRRDEERCPFEDDTE